MSCQQCEERSRSTQCANLLSPNHFQSSYISSHWQTFNKYHINIDDSADEDVLVHFLPSISFIQKELDKGRGVLVHCQAGLSESSISTHSVETNRLQAEARRSSLPT